MFCSVLFRSVPFCSVLFGSCLPVVGDCLKSLEQNTTNCFNSQVYWFKKPSITVFVVLSWKILQIQWPGRSFFLRRFPQFLCVFSSLSHLFAHSQMQCGMCFVGETLLSEFRITSIIWGRKCLEKSIYVGPNIYLKRKTTKPVLYWTRGNVCTLYSMHCALALSFIPSLFLSFIVQVELDVAFSSMRLNKGS